LRTETDVEILCCHSTRRERRRIRIERNYEEIERSGWGQPWIVNRLDVHLLRLLLLHP